MKITAHAYILYLYFSCPLHPLVVKFAAKLVLSCFKSYFSRCDGQFIIYCWTSCLQLFINELPLYSYFGILKFYI